MNVRKFKKVANTLGDLEENFKLFRMWVENCYKMHDKQCRDFFGEVYGNVKPKSKEEITEIDKCSLCCGAFNYGDIAEIYNQMGWELGDNILNRERVYLYQVDAYGYIVWLSEIYSRIQSLECNIEYFYAVITIIDYIPQAEMVTRNFIDKIKKGIVECELEKCYLLVKKERKKVFIAMWFSDDMRNVRFKIEQAIYVCGYQPIMIDVKEHNGQIVPEIFREIEESEFVVADLTGQRGGVYYEAGYAVAKEKQVILSCKEGENPHFDVAQVNTIFWKNENDLYIRLVKRIESTIGAIR